MTEPKIHLGDGVYAKYTGYSIDLLANNNTDVPVVTLELDAIDLLKKFKDEKTKIE